MRILLFIRLAVLIGLFGHQLQPFLVGLPYPVEIGCCADVMVELWGPDKLGTMLFFLFNKTFDQKSAELAWFIKPQLCRYYLEIGFNRRSYAAHDIACFFLFHAFLLPRVTQRFMFPPEKK